MIDEQILSYVEVQKQPYSSPVTWGLMQMFLLDIKIATYMWIDRPLNVPAMEIAFRKGRLNVKAKWVNERMDPITLAGRNGTTQQQTT